jgi:hypothetical protein
MNWQLILTSALISGIVSSIIALYANARMKRIEFNFDFKKYVLKKRIEAYEKIEEFIADFFSDDFQKNLLTWFSSEDQVTVQSIADYRKRVKNVQGSSMWLSGQILNSLHRIDAILWKNLSQTTYLNNPENITDDADEKINSLFASQASLGKNYFTDITKLNDVEAFMKSKKDELHDGIIEMQKTMEGARQLKKNMSSDNL